MQAAAARAPGARFVQVDRGGHAPFLTHADEVAAAIAGFLAAPGLPAPDGARGSP